MPDIYRNVRNYSKPFEHLNTATESSLNCEKKDLIRCLITVGNPSFLTWEKINQYGFLRAVYDSLFEKYFIVKQNIASDKNGIRMHPIFNSYVSDKKRAISYNLGMAFAKYYSEKLLHIPNLIHIEFLKKQNAITFTNTGRTMKPREPDLVGQTNDGNWHLFEAKGTSSSSQLGSKIADAKKQLAQINTIHGAQPLTRSACATYIGTDRVLTNLEDPPGDEIRSIEIDSVKFINSYYAPFLSSEIIPNIRYRTESLDGFSVTFFDLERAGKKFSIGLEEELFERLKQKDYELPGSLIAKHSQFSDIQVEKYSIGLDGFVVKYTE